MNLSTKAFYSQFAPLPFVLDPTRLNKVGLSTRQRWWIKPPQTASKQGNNFPLITHHQLSAGGFYRVWGHGSGAKENAPTAPSLFGVALRLPDPPLCINQTRETPMKKHFFRTLKRYSAVSVNNLINRYSVTAYSLNEARELLPVNVVITVWTPVQEGF
ncbi:MAG: hypothetical protein ACKVJE_21955 [Pseudomonadales bacterium]